MTQKEFATEGESCPKPERPPNVGSSAKPRQKPGETLRQWGERMKQSGRPLLLIPLAQLMAVAQPDAADMVEFALAGKIQRNFPDMSRDQRRKYYRHPRLFWKELIETTRSVLPPELIEGLQFTRLLKILKKRWDRFSPEERKEFSEEFMQELRRLETPQELAAFRENFWKELSPAHLKELQSESGQDFTEQMRQAPSVQFLMCVFFPCMVCYGKSPQELYGESCRGNTTALCNLLRIDKQVMFLQEMAEFQQKFFYEKNCTALSAISAALKGKPQGKRSSRLLKYGIIKFLQSLSAAIPQLFRSPTTEFTSTDFADLFEIVSRENRENHKSAGDCLPEDIGTFRKGLRLSKVNIGMEGWDIFH